MKYRQCNICGEEKKYTKFKNQEKKTCKKCETRWWMRILRIMVMEKKLSPIERMANRIAYMGTAFIMVSPYLLKVDGIGAYTYIIGAILSLPQVWVAKQWNIVALNVNLLIGYGVYIATTLI
tara:strand:- start:735 stop:1100 length:366 start_codon:yes stop_codon:yes gene_type:complete